MNIYKLSYLIFEEKKGKQNYRRALIFLKVLSSRKYILG